MSERGLTIGFDTSAAHCAAALVMEGRVLRAESLHMPRGQAEALMPLLTGILAAEGADWRDVARLGVGVGPGNFTGIRIAVAAARGLAFGLKRPAIGVTNFEALLLDAPEGAIALVPAPRGLFWHKPAGGAAELRPGEEIGEAEAPVVEPGAPEELAAAIARIAEVADPARRGPARPLYLRPADAAPPSEAPPLILP